MTVYSIQRNGLEFIGDDVRKGSQSWTREATVTWSGHKIRVHIERDSYDKQSRIYSEVFSATTLSWNRVQSLSGLDHTDLVSGYEKDETKILVSSNALLNNLIAYVQQILEDTV
jgi:hypothetical protein